MPPSPPVLRGVHRRLALPPPPARPSLLVWRDLADADDDLAWALFALSRRVRDVADAPPTGTTRWSHAADVRAAAANAPDIAADLLVLGARYLSLTGVRAGKVAGACNRLAAWAAEQGFGEAAVQFAETAVAIQPGNARRVFEAARINRRFSRIGDAELLYSRAIVLSRESKNWAVYARSHLGMGHVCKHRGRLDHAAAHYSTAARCARDRSGEKWLAAMIEHDLFALAAEEGELERAHRHALRASEWIPTHHEDLPGLIHDYSYLLLEMRAPALALKLLDALLQKRLPSAFAVITWSTYARAVAAMGDLPRYRNAEREIEALVPRFDLYAAPAHANLATGAYLLNLPTDAEAHALRSVELARARSDERVRVEAEKILAQVSQREPPQSQSDSEPSASMRRLTDDLLTRLRVWRGSTWSRKRQSGAAQLGNV